MRHLFLLCLLFFSALSAETVINLNGHLDKKTLDVAAQQLTNNTVLVIDSSSGDLDATLSFAQKLYNRDQPLTVYIKGRAIGPAAILPFLASDLYSSHFVTWGDIPYGVDKQIPANILRNQVTNLIRPNQKPILTTLAIAMSDPNVILIEENGKWVIDHSGEKKGKIISAKEEALILNQHTAKDLGLIQFAPLERFVVQTPETPVTLDRELKEHIKVKSGENVIGHILIDDRKSGINQSTWIYVKKALDYYKEIKPDFVILELNTPGGEVFAAQKISDALKELDTQQGIPVVTVINNWAISAGAMLAYSTRFITTVKDGTMGAAEPVMPGEGGKMESASEKINSALRADFASRSRFYDRNPDIAEAMVDKDIILVWRHDKVMRLASEDDIRKSDQVISAKGKLLTLSAKELMKYDVADMLLLPKKHGAITAEELSKGTWPAEKMLLFHYPFFDEIPNAIVKSYRMDWRTMFFAFLTTPMVSSALMLGVMLGFYMEFSTPGFGLPGAVGLVSLFLIVLSSFALEIGSLLELVLLIAGIGMLLIELFVLPSFGLVGFTGIALILAGLVGLLLPGLGSIDYEFDTGTFNAAGEVIMQRLAWLSGTIVVGLIAMVALGRYVVPSFAGFSRLVLRGGEQDVSEGYYAGAIDAELPKIGSTGIVAATMRPSGRIEIDGKIYEAITAGSFIEEGTKIVVTNVEGNTIIVGKEEAKV